MRSKSVVVRSLKRIAIDIATSAGTKNRHTASYLYSYQFSPCLRALNMAHARRAAAEATDTRRVQQILFQVLRSVKEFIFNDQTTFYDKDFYYY